MVNKKLFEEFPPVSTEKWEAVITKDLKGADYDKKLVWKTNDGFKVQPYYRAEDLKTLGYLDVEVGKFPYVRGTRAENDWLVRQNIWVSGCSCEANAKAVEILGKGINSIEFVLTNEKEWTAERFSRLFKDINLEKIEVNLRIPKKNVETFAAFVEFVKGSGYNAENIRGSFNYDPLGNLTTKGEWCGSEEKSFENIKTIIELAKPMPLFRVIGVDGAVYHNAGGTTVEELAFTLAHGATYLTRLTDMGLKIEEIAPRIKFNMAVSSNYFMEIAKFRAARLLWANIVGAYGCKCECCPKMVIHAENGIWNKSIYDPYVNMLRTTTETMSATLAGVDSFTVLPFNYVYEKATEFSERIARNQQLLLKFQSRFNKVVDPAAGSYYIEELTNSIAEAAWKIFLEVDEKGGYIKCLENIFVQETIKKSAEILDKEITTRKRIVLGTNQYPNFTETVDADELCSCAIKPWDVTVENPVVETLKPYRGAMAFERMRLATERFAKADHRPIAFMLCIGDLAMRRARAQFAMNFFACAGFKVVDNNGFNSIEEGVKAAMAVKADIIVLCSSDDEYVVLAPEAMEAINGKAVFVVAGAPACTDDLKAQGIMNFINVKSNVLNTLVEYQKMLGIN